MNNKLFRILMLFISVCVASVTTLLAVSFGLSNSGLETRNEELNEENKDLNDEVQELNKVVDKLQDTIDNLDEHAAIATYVVDGAVWRIQIVQKDKEFELPVIEETDTQVYNGWKIDGAGESMTKCAITDDTEFVLDMVNKDWVKVNWFGLNNFNASNIWTDGTDYYYSEGNIHFKKDPVNNAWEQVTWSGLTEFSGRHVWNYNGKTYYSDATTTGEGNKNYVLNTANNTWLTTGWSEFLVGDFIFVIDGVCYYNDMTSPFTGEYTFDGETWEKISAGNIIGGSVWTDGTDYYACNTTPGRYGGNLIWNRNTGKWETISWKGVVANAANSRMYGSNVWTDGTNLYYSSNVANAVIDIKNLTLSEKTWIGGPSSLYGENIWTDGENIYYSKGTEQYVFAK